MTYKERLASLEAQHRAHGREHDYLDRAWAGQLEAINVRLRNIEASLNGWSSSGSGQRRFSSRDMGMAEGGIAFATAVWWLVDLLRAAGGV